MRENGLLQPLECQRKTVIDLFLINNHLFRTKHQFAIINNILQQFFRSHLKTNLALNIGYLSMSFE